MQIRQGKKKPKYCSIGKHFYPINQLFLNFEILFPGRQYKKHMNEISKTPKSSKSKIS